MKLDVCTAGEVYQHACAASGSDLGQPDSISSIYMRGVMLWMGGWDGQ